mmetsp:Transcript_7515/g.9042  ORF Transcript_7515/g.9042 Transcript_7515/m.9042 type:complete len:389 (-) Transcript_7515:73-1239(-)
MFGFLRRRVVSSLVQVTRDGFHADNRVGDLRWKSIAWGKGLSVELVEKCFFRFSIRKRSNVSIQRLSNYSKPNIRNLVKKKRHRLAWEKFQEMLQNGANLTKHDYNVAVSCVCKLKIQDNGAELFKNILENDIEISSFSFASLLLLMMNSNTDKANVVIQSFVRSLDTGTLKLNLSARQYEVLIEKSRKSGYLDLGLSLITSMTIQKVSPTLNTVFASISITEQLSQSKTSQKLLSNAFRSGILKKDILTADKYGCKYLDLHGFEYDTSRALVLYFLHSMVLGIPGNKKITSSNNLESIRTKKLCIIVGKGLHANADGSRGVLREEMFYYLRDELGLQPHVSPRNPGRIYISTVNLETLEGERRNKYKRINSHWKFLEDEFDDNNTFV